MDDIRLATIDEIKEIEDTADLIPGSVIVAFGPDKAVIRTAVEIDPVYCDSPKRKAWLLKNLETWLRLNGVSQYYFNIDAEDTTWRETVEAWGAKKVSQTPELRFKKEL